VVAVARQVLGGQVCVQLDEEREQVAPVDALEVLEPVALAAALNAEAVAQVLHQHLGEAVVVGVGVVVEQPGRDLLGPVDEGDEVDLGVVEQQRLPGAKAQQRRPGDRPGLVGR
jgi:hypothetical protein